MFQEEICYYIVFRKCADSPLAVMSFIPFIIWQIFKKWTCHFPW